MLPAGFPVQYKNSVAQKDSLENNLEISRIKVQGFLLHKLLFEHGMMLEKELHNEFLKICLIESFNKKFQDDNMNFRVLLHHHQKTSIMKQLILIGCLSLSLAGVAQYTYKNLDINFGYTEAQLKNYTHENLRLYPIKARQSFVDTFEHVGKYMSLKVALEKKKVIITEQLGGATVNTLTIENVSADTIMVMAGEVITGGKQNRIIGKDIILLPHSGKIDISVYCVEAGRWETVSTGSSRFSGYFNVGSMGLRKVVDKKQNQGDVWAKVDSINSLNSTSSNTRTYTAINKSEDFTKKLKAYKDFFKEKFSTEKNVVGVVVVSGNKVLGCDMFATSDLFKNNLENLLASYATDAIISGSAVTATPQTVKSYMDKLLRNEEDQSATIKEKGKVFTNNGKKMRVTSYE